jgi:ABC-type sugar transport system ATPase subunit
MKKELLGSCQQMFVIAHALCTHPACVCFARSVDVGTSRFIQSLLTTVAREQVSKEDIRAQEKESGDKIGKDKASGA